MKLTMEYHTRHHFIRALEDQLLYDNWLYQYRVPLKLDAEWYQWKLIVQQLTSQMYDLIAEDDNGLNDNQILKK